MLANINFSDWQFTENCIHSKLFSSYDVEPLAFACL